MIQKHTHADLQFSVRVITDPQSSVDAAVSGLTRRDWLLVDQKLAEKITGQTDPVQQALTFAIASVPAPEIDDEVDFDQIEDNLPKHQVGNIANQPNWLPVATTIVVVCGETIVTYAGGSLQTATRRSFVKDDCPDEIIAAIESRWPNSDTSPRVPTKKAADAHVQRRQVKPSPTPSIATEI